MKYTSQNSLRKIGRCAFANASVVYTDTVTRKLLIACTQDGNMQKYHVTRFWRLKVKDKPELYFKDYELHRIGYNRKSTIS